MGYLYLALVVAAMLAVASLARATETTFSNAAGAALVGVVLYGLAILAVSRPTAYVLGSMGSVTTGPTWPSSSASRARSSG